MFPRSRLTTAFQRGRSRVAAFRPTVRSFTTIEESKTGPVGQYFEQVGKGITQMLFVENTFVGYAILGAVTYASPASGLALFSGSALSIMFARMIGATPPLIENGLIAFNGILVALALTAVLPHTWVLPTAIVAGTFVSTYLFDLGCKKLTLPVFSFPFIAATLPILCIVTPVCTFGTVPLPTQIILPTPEMITTAVTLVPLVYANLFFGSAPFTGAVMIGGQAIADYRTAISGVCGAALGILIGSMLGYDVSSGLWGFNAALTAMALYPSFEKPFWAAMGGAALSSVLYPFAIFFWGSMGLPALSTTFCIASIFVIYLYQLAQKK